MACLRAIFTAVRLARAPRRARGCSGWVSEPGDGAHLGRSMDALCIRPGRDPVLEATQAADDTPVQSPTASNQPVNNAA